MAKDIIFKGTPIEDLIDGFNEPSFWEAYREKNIDRRIQNNIEGKPYHDYLLFNTDSKNIYDMALLGKYQAIFEDTKKLVFEVMKKEITILDYHYLYDQIIDILFVEIIGYYEKGDYKVENTDYSDVFYAYQKEVRKVQVVFNEYVKKLEDSTKDNLKLYFSNMLEDFFNNNITDIKPPTSDKTYKLEIKLKEEGHLLDDLTTISSRSTLESIADGYWKTFENVIPSMLKKYKKESDGENYAASSIEDAIKKTKPDYLKRKRKNNKK